MTKVTKRLVSVVMASALVFGLAAGCSTKNSKGNETSTQQTTQAEEPKKKGKISVSIYDRGTCDPSEGTMTENRWTKWINEKGPAEVTFISVPRWESVQRWPVMFASDTAPDLILEFDSTIKNQLYAQKLLMPIDELIQKHSVEYKKMTEQMPAMIKAGKKPDGKVYEFVKAAYMYNNGRIGIRVDWLKKLNLNVPKTADELYTVAKAFAEKDPDGNGKRDTFGLNLSGPGYFWIYNMFGVSPIGAPSLKPWIIENDKLIFPWDRLKAATEFQKKLFDEKIVDTDYLTDKNGDKAKQDWINGKLGIISFNGDIASTNELTAFRKNFPDAEIDFLEVPSSQFGKFSTSAGNPIQLCAVVNAKAKDPVSVMKYVDFMSKPETAKYLKFGEEGRHYSLTPDGFIKTIDTQLNKKEHGYNVDFRMLNHDLLTGNIFNVTADDAIAKESSKLSKNANKLYLDNKMVNTVLPEFLPILPQDLIVGYTESEKLVRDILTKCIVGGSEWPADKAMNEAKAAWKKAGGEKVDEYYAKWYQDNKKDVITTDELYKYPRKPEAPAQK